MQSPAPRHGLEYLTVALVMLNAFLLMLEFQVEGEVVGTSLKNGRESLGPPLGSFFRNVANVQPRKQQRMAKTRCTFTDMRL